MKKLLFLIFFFVSVVGFSQPSTTYTNVKTNANFNISGQAGTSQSGCSSFTCISGCSYQQYGFLHSGTYQWAPSCHIPGAFTTASYNWSTAGPKTLTYVRRSVVVNTCGPPGCSFSSVTNQFNITVHVVANLAWTGNFPGGTTICANDDPLNLNNYLNYNTTSYTIGGQTVNSNIFDPSDYAPGNYVIGVTRSFTNGPTTIQRSIEILPVDEINVDNVITDYCADGSDVNLTDMVSFTGSNLQIDCVSGNCGGAMFYNSGGDKFFRPSFLGEGTNYSSVIRFSYTAPNGCQDAKELEFNISAGYNINAGSNFSICKNASPIALGGTNSSGQTGVWSGTGVSGSNFNPGNAAVQAGEQYTLTYTVTSGSCVKTDTKVVTVNPAPVLSFANTSAARCNNTTVNLNSVYGPRNNGSAISNVTWSSNNGTVNAAINNTTNVLNLNGISAGNYNLTFQFTDGNGCTSSVTQNNAITVNATPGLPTITPSQDPPYCGPTNVTLTASGAGGGQTYRWYNASDVQIALGPTFNTGTLSVGTHIFKATRVTTATGCESGFRTHEIVVQNLPTVNTSKTTAELCTGNGTVNLFDEFGPSPSSGTFSSTNSTINSRLSGSGNGNLNITGIPQGTFPLTYTVTSGCSNNVGLSLVFSVGAASPSVPSVKICEPGVITLSVQNPQGGLIYRWYTVASGGSSFHTGSTYTTPFLESTEIYYVEAFNSGNGCTSLRTAVEAEVINVGEVVAGPDIGFCTNNVSLNLAPDANPAGGTFSGQGVSGNVFTGNSLPNNNEYTVTYTYNFGGCTYVATRVISLGFSVNVTVTPPDTVNLGQMVNFRHNYNNATETAWTFGDGWSSTLLSPNHYYYNEGDMDVSVFIKLPEGCSQTFQFPEKVYVLPFDIVTGFEDLSEIEASLYPNPVVSELTFLSPFEGSANLLIMDMNGKILSQSDQKLRVGTNVLPYNFEEVRSGIYFVLVRLDNGNYRNFKIIKQ